MDLFVRHGCDRTVELGRTRMGVTRSCPTNDPQEEKAE